MDMGHLMTGNYMEHGLCLNWEPALVSLHVGSDIVTGVAYYSIPLAMFYCAYRRRDLPFYKTFIMFAVFIVSCGTTHFLSAYTIFRPEYWVEGYVKAFTAAISALTAVVFIPRLPEVIALPSVLSTFEEIRKLNGQLSVKNAELEMANFSIENVLVPIYWISSDARILRANKAACSILGYSSEELLGMSVGDVVPSFSPEQWAEQWRELKDKKSLVLETRHRKKDGELLDVDVTVDCITYEGIEYYCALVRDTTARKRAERELRANESRMTSLYNISQFPFVNEQLFLDHALEEVIRLSESTIGYIYLYNEQSRQFTLNTWSGNVMAQCSVRDQKTVYDLDSTGLWGDAVRLRKPVLLNDFKADNVGKKGYPEGHVDLVRFLTVPLIVDDVIVAVVGVANKDDDYTDLDLMQLQLFMDSVWMIILRKRSENDRIEFEKQLLHAQKLESLGVLAGGIAHDFNNILMAIMGNADLALMKLSTESPVRENLHSIETAAARAADLAKQMLAYSGKGKFIVEPIDLNRLLEEVMHLLKVSISKKAVLRFNPTLDLPTMEADATQIRQVIMNLVINASEAIGDRSGVIAISTGCMDCDRAYLKNVWLDDDIPEGTYVYLEISDTGCGMDSDVVSKIFDPFFRGNPARNARGAGLGLTLAKKIIENHRGTISLESQLNKGTSVIIVIPISSR